MNPSLSRHSNGAYIRPQPQPTTLIALGRSKGMKKSMRHSLTLLLFVGVTSASAVPVISVDLDPGVAGIQSTVSIYGAGSSFKIKVTFTGDGATLFDAFSFEATVIRSSVERLEVRVGSSMSMPVTIRQPRGSRCGQWMPECRPSVWRERWISNGRWRRRLGPRRLLAVDPAQWRCQAFELHRTSRLRVSWRLLCRRPNRPGHRPC